MTSWKDMILCANIVVKWQNTNWNTFEVMFQLTICWILYLLNIIITTLSILNRIQIESVHHWEDQNKNKEEIPFPDSIKTSGTTSIQFNQFII